MRSPPLQGLAAIEPLLRTRSVIGARCCTEACRESPPAVSIGRTSAAGVAAGASRDKLCLGQPRKG